MLEGSQEVGRGGTVRHLRGLCEREAPSPSKESAKARFVLPVSCMRFSIA
jgi:hypothetical protein